MPSWKLSPNVFERFQIASNLANLFKKHNIRGDFGYHTLLYGRTAELRQVFIAVIEKLPKHPVSRETDQSAVSNLLLSVRTSLDSSLTWVPEFCRRLRMKREGRLWVPPDNEPDTFFFSSSGKRLWDALAHGHSRPAIATVIRSSELSGSVSQPRSKPPIRAKPRIPLSSKQQANFECLIPEKEISCESHSSTKLDSRQTRLDGVMDLIANKQKELAKVEGEIADYRTQTAFIIESLGSHCDNFAAFLMDPEVSKVKVLAYLEGSERPYGET
ncbi:hypothetical protein KIN20_009816 [Parelaphostrongylus tenuis]|uniref:CCDC22 N-terminal domain-containing protein n=1 Tax=Parelaphostrongylus tenuis TaxID=148309 RepID=A0AAD5M6Y5_PARTN|nr:hypothetical protein KIN20_009816 [Parelaphostrongylus tenuis]